MPSHFHPYPPEVRPDRIARHNTAQDIATLASYAARHPELSVTEEIYGLSNMSAIAFNGLLKQFQRYPERLASPRPVPANLTAQ